MNAVFKLSVAIALIIITCLMSCKKFVQVEAPITNINGENVFDENTTTMGVLTGIYTRMSGDAVANTGGWLTNIFLVTGLTGDELELFNKTEQTFGPYYFNNIPPTGTWDNIYKMIYTVNSGIEKIPDGKLTHQSVKNQALGEAKFIRALCFFYLVNIYGGVPLTVSTDYKINELLPRASEQEVYSLIISDLKDAQNLLSKNFVGSDGVSVSTERVRPNAWAATALLSRVYLYQKRYQDALDQANSVINHSQLFELVSLDEVFLKNSKEAIWQLQPVGIQTDKTANTQDGQLLKILPITNEPFVYLNSDLVNSFDSRDLRSNHWIGTVTTLNGSQFTFAYKYKIGWEEIETQEYNTVLRLGEQYLIRAECLINLGQVAEGISDLNAIRGRATDMLVPEEDRFPAISTSLSQQSALAILEEERRHELFTEWGHRWLDAKRTGRADQLFGHKSGWQTTDQLFPLPGNEVASNPNLKGKQNPGY